MITRDNAFFLGWRRTALEYFVKSLFQNSPATMNDGRVELASVTPHLLPGTTILDIGAHVGVFSRRFAELAPTCAIVAFEPQSLPRAVFTLSGFLRKPKNILIVPCALGSASGLIELNVPIKKKGSVAVGLAHIGDDKDLQERFVVKKEVVLLARLDDVLRNMNLGPISFIKIDVEGGELDVLRGAEETLAFHRPTLLCEIDGREERFGTTSAAFYDFLSERGYVAQSLENGRILSIETLEKNTLFVHQSGRLTDAARQNK